MQAARKGNLNNSWRRCLLRPQRAGAREAKPSALAVVIQGLSLFGDGFNFSLPHARRIPKIQPTESPILTFLCLERIDFLISQAFFCMAVNSRGQVPLNLISYVNERNLRVRLKNKRAPKLQKPLGKGCF
eukprot:1136529-Pelagomonas_calceolata.AAC.1